MITKEQINEYERLCYVRAEAEAKERIARLRILCAIGENEQSQYDVTITHDQIAKEAGVKNGTVIKWIRTGELKAKPKEEGRRKYQISFSEWQRFKRRRGIA